MLVIAGIGVGALGTATILSTKVTPASYAQAGPNGLKQIGQPSNESLAELRNLDNSYASLAEFVSPAVVDIQATSGRQQAINGARMPSRGSEGSGFIFRADGYIITNDHVVDGADKVKVILKDGRSYEGKVIRASESDLAVVKIEATGLPTLAFADSSKVRPGQQVMATGAPFGMQQSVTFGHVSAINRTNRREDSLTRHYADLIQTDTSINMGNSGGPLVDIDGRVIGVNTLIYSPSGTSAGIGFAIPSNQVKFIADTLISKGKVSRSMLGLIPGNIEEYKLKDLGIPGGALVEEVNPDTPAAKAGLEKGDIITKIGSAEIRNEQDLRNAMIVNAPGTTVNIDYIRGKSRKSTSVKLVEFKAPVAQQQDLRLPNDMELGPDIFKQLDPNRRQPQPTRPQTRPQSDKPRLGVGIIDATAETRKEYNLPSNASGAVVGSIDAGSMADEIGMKPGDVITEFGGKRISSAKDLADAVAGIKWGDSRRIRFTRYVDNGQLTEERDVIFRR